MSCIRFELGVIIMLSQIRDCCCWFPLPFDDSVAVLFSLPRIALYSSGAVIGGEHATTLSQISLSCCDVTALFKTGLS